MNKKKPQPSNNKHLYYIRLIVAVIIATGVFFYLFPSHRSAQNKHATNHQKSNLILKNKIQAADTQAPTNSEQPWTTLSVKKGDNLSSILQKHRVDNKTIVQIMQTQAQSSPLKKLQPGQSIDIQVDASGHLYALKLHFNRQQFLSIHRKNNSFETKIVNNPLLHRSLVFSGTINHSLDEAMQQAKLSPKIRLQIKQIFHQKLNFKRNIHPGDQFKLVINETQYPDHQIEQGPILAAEIITKKQPYHAIYFPTPGMQNAYYDLKGHNLDSRFYRAPLKYAFISSYFSLGRYHPILHVVRPHYGIDYAAVIGTPVHAASDGVITFFGNRGGYGNVVTIKHGPHYSTLYAHLSRFKKGLKRHEKVKAGQIIAYVGETGLATGPHLHFEIHHNGIPRNPLTVKLPDGKPIPRRYHHQFIQVAAKRIEQVNNLKNTPWNQGLLNQLT